MKSSEKWEKWEKVVKSGQKWSKVVKSGEKWGKVANSVICLEFLQNSLWRPFWMTENHFG